MNRFLIYILPLIAALLFSCSQQSEASYVEEADEVAMGPGEIEKFKQTATYSWEVSTDEQQKDLFVEDSEIEKIQNMNNDTSHNFIDTKGVTNNGLSINENTVTSGAVNIDQSEFLDVTKDKVLMAFVKTNIEDVIDLLLIYNASSQDEEMADVAKLAIEDYLLEVEFKNLESALSYDADDSKKLKMSAISINEEGNFQGSVKVKGSSQKSNIDYIIISTETAYGTSRKFKIVGIN